MALGAVLYLTTLCSVTAWLYYLRGAFQPNGFCDSVKTAVEKPMAGGASASAGPGQFAGSRGAAGALGERLGALWGCGSRGPARDGSVPAPLPPIRAAAMALCGAIHSFLFEYDTPRIVLIRSRKVGLINRAVQLGILAYVIG